MSVVCTLPLRTCSQSLLVVLPECLALLVAGRRSIGAALPTRRLIRLHRHYPHVYIATTPTNSPQAKLTTYAKISIVSIIVLTVLCRLQTTFFCIIILLPLAAGAIQGTLFVRSFSILCNTATLPAPRLSWLGCGRRLWKREYNCTSICLLKTICSCRDCYKMYCDKCCNVYPLSIILLSAAVAISVRTQGKT